MRLRAVVAAATIAAAGCGAAQSPTEKSTGRTGLMPAATSLEGFRIAEGPIQYAPIDLYEYVNGGADRYLAHGFRELQHVRYELGEDPLACITLDVYDMGSVLGAFGIYRAAAPPAEAARPWGTEGSRVGTTAAAWKGPIFVHGEADDERPELIAALEAAVAATCRRVPGPAVLPPELEPLPAGGRVPLSERWVPADLLGYSFLPGGLIATYEADSGRSELYLSDLGSPAAAAEALSALRERLEGQGTVDPTPALPGEGAFRYEVSLLGAGTAAISGRWVLGIHGELDARTREAVLASLAAGLL
jgi:hypothetical protein